MVTPHDLIIRIALVSCVLVGFLANGSPSLAQVLPPIITPSPGSTLTTTTVEFTGGHASQAGEEHYLSVGSGTGAFDNNIYHQSMGTGHTATVSGLPTSGTLHVLYWTKTNAAPFGFRSHTYTMNVVGGSGDVGDVNVVNEPNVNVVNEPNVNVVNEPNVNVVNEPNVNVLNNVGATVTNNTANPVPVVVQNGTTSAPARELVEITHTSIGNNIPSVVYTVPTGKRLIITDVTISFTSSLSVSGDFLIQRNNVTISRARLKNDGGFTDGSVYQRSYLSGIQFNEGDTVGLNCTNAPGFFELRGYLTDTN